ncbi:N-formylglutamate amidohydrolase, partial [Sphingomonas sp. ASV193]|uniref:N-formylglutamate amidohydrolase n=1 Tax=Sphingomonas sp. ASV193 TaxID=3144405 RepID=UPI0032E870FE
SIDRLAPPLEHESHGDLPVLLSIPHAGTDYPDWLLGKSTGGRVALEPLEDPIVDRLAWRAIAAGTGAVVARTPRAAIDCNRSLDELDPLTVDFAIEPGERSPRLRAGLGLFPSRTPRHGALWRRPMTRAETEARIAQAYRPYHRAIAERLERLALVCGEALLIDLHSMPPRPRGQPQAQVVIGDRFGTSAAPWLTDLAAATVRRAGFTAACNDPFAGGEIVARHGRPATGIHAFQVEIDRTTYCQADCRSPGPGFERVATLVALLVERLGSAIEQRRAIAAE